MCDLILNRENVGQIAVVAVGPDVIPCFSFDELRSARLRDFHAVNGYLPPRGALRALELGWQRLVPCVSNLRRSAVRAIGGDAISGSAPRPSGTGGLQTLCWEVDWNPRFPARGARVCANPGDPRGRVARHLVSVWLGYSETSTTAAGARA
jgi:hypothetical protein